MATQYHLNHTGSADLFLACETVVAEPVPVAAAQFGYSKPAPDFSVRPSRVEVCVGLDPRNLKLDGIVEVMRASRAVPKAEGSFLSEVEETHV
jgi:hypothetical protein